MAKKEKKTESAKASQADYSIVRRPLVTEKATSLSGRSSGASTQQCVEFEVARGSTKCEIKGAVERLFNVKVDSVRTLNCQGKVKRTMRGEGRRNNTKRAFVTLKEGSNINVVEGV